MSELSKRQLDADSAMRDQVSAGERIGEHWDKGRPVLRLRNGAPLIGFAIADATMPAGPPEVGLLARLRRWWRR